MVKEKVVFDTNRLYNKKATSFFAKNISDLDKFAKVSEIILPDMVVGELEEKYKRDFEDEKEKFLKTILNTLLSHDVDILNINEKIEKLKEDEVIEYSVIELKDDSVLSKIKELALKKELPFKKGVKEDPGFKDTYIYFTILEFLQEIDDKYIFVCTHDVGLSEALEKHQNIIVVKDYNEFIKKSVSKVQDDEFISRINEGISRQLNEENLPPLLKKVESNNFIDYWINKDQNRIFHIEDNGRDLLVEIDSGEVLNINEGIEYKKLSLLEVETFNLAHGIIEQLYDAINFLTHEEIMKVFDGYINSSQVSGTMGFGQSKKFLNILFDSKKDILDKNIKKKIEKMLK